MRLDGSRVRPLVVPMVLLAAVGLPALGAYLWLLAAGPARAAWWITAVAGALVLWVVPVAVVGVACLLVCVHGRPPRAFLVPARLVLRLLFPVVLEVARLFRVDTERVQGAFVYVHNRIVQAGLSPPSAGFAPSSTLVLLPHCLQRVDCPHRITWDVENCGRCGRCAVGDALELSEELGFRLAVASGGSQARRLLGELDPDVVVAVACERELAEGIRDVSSTPVLAILNLRPEGPCRNTSVRVDDLKTALHALKVRFGPGVCEVSRRGPGPIRDSDG